MPRLKILFVVSECAPFVKVGGLGDVAGALPVALSARGHDVRLVMPRYRQAKRVAARQLPEPLGVPMGYGTRWAGVWETEVAPGVPLYLIEHDELFDRDGIYNDSRGEFPDNLTRFAFLSRAALELLPYLAYEPDVIHVHDWPSALVPVFIRVLGPLGLGTRSQIATVLSIHNLGYQGLFSLAEFPVLGIGPEHLHPGLLEHYGRINLLKAGLWSATMLSTVSPQYALEIQTPLGGAGLDGIMRHRSLDFVGVLNGIDEQYWDPATDPLLPAHYDAEDLAGKAACKAALQQELGLPVRADVPLIGLVSRLAQQKGIDILLDALGELLERDLQFAILGAGEPWAEEAFRLLSVTTTKLRAEIGYHERLAHWIEAGADLFVMPSHYEPCGLNQMYSQRYGTLPVVRAVGGLRDTVQHHRTGFVFEELSGAALARTIVEAAEIYRTEPKRFRTMQRAAMTKSMGWDRAAGSYDALYRMAIGRNAGRL